MGNPHYEKANSVISEAEFDKKIRENIDSFGGLIDEDAAALLVLDVLGKLEIKMDKISKIGPNMAVNIKGRVKSVGPVRSFQKRSGETGEVVNLEVADQTGTVRMVLWDADTELVKSGKISRNSIVRVINAYAKQGRFELEVGLGRGGTIVIE